ncbi:hypothetical protein SLA2020_381860 [Shorea laevis]
MPQRHSKNNNDLAFFTYDEKRKLGYGTDAWDKQSTEIQGKSSKEENDLRYITQVDINYRGSLRGSQRNREEGTTNFIDKLQMTTSSL